MIGPCTAPQQKILSQPGRHRACMQVRGVKDSAPTHIIDIVCELAVIVRDLVRVLRRPQAFTDAVGRIARAGSTPASSSRTSSLAKPPTMLLLTDASVCKWQRQAHYRLTMTITRALAWWSLTGCIGASKLAGGIRARQCMPSTLCNQAPPSPGHASLHAASGAHASKASMQSYTARFQASRGEEGVPAHPRDEGLGRRG